MHFYVIWKRMISRFNGVILKYWSKWNWKLLSGFSRTFLVQTSTLPKQYDWSMTHWSSLEEPRPADSGLAVTADLLAHRSLWPGLGLWNNWQHGKAVPPRLPPFLSSTLLLKLEFVPFAQLHRNLLQQEVHAGLSPPAETAAKGSERGRDVQIQPSHPEGCLRVTMRGDPPWQAASI